MTVPFCCSPEPWEFLRPRYLEQALQMVRTRHDRSFPPLSGSHSTPVRSLPAHSLPFTFSCTTSKLPTTCLLGDMEVVPASGLHCVTQPTHHVLCTPAKLGGCWSPESLPRATSAKRLIDQLLMNCCGIRNCSSLCPIAVQRCRDHSNSYKGKHLTGAGL